MVEDFVLRWFLRYVTRVVHSISDEKSMAEMKSLIFFLVFLISLFHVDAQAGPGPELKINTCSEQYAQYQQWKLVSDGTIRLISNGRNRYRCPTQTTIFHLNVTNRVLRREMHLGERRQYRESSSGVDRTLPFSSSKPALDLLPRRHSSV
jgi:hypothetical protein